MGSDLVQLGEICLTPYDQKMSPLVAGGQDDDRGGGDLRRLLVPATRLLPHH